MQAFDFEKNINAITEIQKLSYRAGLEAGYKVGMQEGKKEAQQIERVHDDLDRKSGASAL